MWRTRSLVCTALLLTACVGPLKRETEPDKPSPPKVEQTFPPRIGAVDIGEPRPPPKPEQPPPSRAEQDLSSGIRAYEDADYRAASRLLQSALDSGLLLNSDKIVAHKYVAFIHCAERRDRLCRDEFRKALELDPKFDLDPAEAGHPLWGPVFKAIKAEMGRRPQR